MADAELRAELDKIWGEMKEMRGDIGQLREGAARSDENRTHLASAVQQLTGKVDGMTITLAHTTGGWRVGLAVASVAAATVATLLNWLFSHIPLH